METAKGTKQPEHSADAALGQQAFWDTFRAAMASNDPGKVADLARFPFKVRGAMDSDPVESYDRAGFLKIYKRLVQQEVYSAGDGELQAHSMRQVVGTHASTPPLQQGDRFSVEQFEFERIDGQWRFVFAYLDDGE